LQQLSKLLLPLRLDKKFNVIIGLMDLDEIFHTLIATEVESITMAKLLEIIRSEAT